MEPVSIPSKETELGQGLTKVHHRHLGERETMLGMSSSQIRSQW